MEGWLVRSGTVRMDSCLDSYLVLVRSGFLSGSGTVWIPVWIFAGLLEIPEMFFMRHFLDKKRHFLDT